MFDIISDWIVEFAGIMPSMIILILAFNLMADLLFKEW